MGFDEPESIDITSLGDPYVHHVMSRPSYTITSTGTSYTGGYTSVPWKVDANSLLTWIQGDVDKDMQKKIEEVHAMTIHEDGRFIINCDNEQDLSPEHILTSMSAIKGKLMLNVSPIHIQRFECSMTPQVRANILQACKRLKMYGKKMPIVPRFDEYGFRLPDEINIDTLEGMTLNIVDPKLYGDLYFELRAIEFPSTSYNTEPTWSYIDDTPF